MCKLNFDKFFTRLIVSFFIFSILIILITIIEQPIASTLALEQVNGGNTQDAYIRVYNEIIRPWSWIVSFMFLPWVVLGLFKKEKVKNVKS